MEAMLLAPMLRPMLGDSGALGSYGVDLLAHSIAERDAGGFAATLASALERRS